ncbi:MAG: ATP-dependent Clp protease proteolytic subunit [Candidatus Kapabacteria bacterium]|nr:ATP-dependent Clp protease proteolytic subunit [Candidatus Kapabacteria bacterium]
MEIDIFGQITPWGDEDWGVSAKMIRKKLENHKEGEELTVYINSVGGSVFEGIAIYNLLAEKRPIIKIIGEASSIASVISCAGREVMIAETAMMLIHKPWTVVIGNADEMQKVAKDLEAIKDSIIAAYKTKTGMEAEDIDALMSEDRYMTATECLEYKLVDKIYSPTQDEVKKVILAKTQIYAMKHRNSKPITITGGNMDPKDAQITELNNKVVEFSSQITAIQSENETLKTTNSELMKTHDELSTQISTLNAQVATMQQQELVNQVRLDIERIKDKILPAENSEENKYELEQELIMLKTLSMDEKYRINGKTPYDKRIEEIASRKSLSSLEDPLPISAAVVNLSQVDFNTEEGREKTHEAILAIMKRDSIDDYNQALQILMKEIEKDA